MNYGKIDVSLTSISSRMRTLPTTIRSILAQDYSDVQVHLHLSRAPYLLDKGVAFLPRGLRALQEEAGERLQIHWCENMGPYRKLLPYLYRNWGESRLVVTADDDTIYPDDWLRSLVEAYDSFGCVVANRGHRLYVRGGVISPYRSWMRSDIEDNPSTLIVPTGKDGILYDTAFFPISVLNYEDAARIAPTADDLWLRWNLCVKGIQVFLMNTDYRSKTFEEADYGSSLYRNFNFNGRNDKAIADLEDYFELNYGFRVSQMARF
jgi:hypothetical protein